MAPALFTDDYIKRMCPENQPIPLRRMSVLEPTTEPAYLARGFTGIRYVPQPSRPPRNVETLARTMASMRMGVSGYGDDDVRQQRAVIQAFVQGAAPAPAAPAPAAAPAPIPAPNGPAAIDSDSDDDGPGAGGGPGYYNSEGFKYGTRVDGVEYVPPTPDSDSDDDGPGAGGGPGYYNSAGVKYGVKDEPDSAPQPKNEDGSYYNRKGFKYGARVDARTDSVSARQSEARSAGLSGRRRKNEGGGVPASRIPQNPSGQQYSGKRKNEGGGGGGGGTRQNRTVDTRISTEQRNAFANRSRGAGGAAEQGTRLTVQQRRFRRDEEEYQRGAAEDRKGKHKKR